MFCKSCGAQVDEGVAVCPNCGQPVEQQADMQVVLKEQGLGLKWANFLGYFALWAGALVNLFAGVKYFTGSIYEDAGTGASADLVYSVLGDSLKFLDKTYAVLLWCTCIICVFAALSIIKRKKTTRMLVCLVYGLNVALGLIYSLGVTAIVGQSAFTTVLIMQLVFSVVMICVNWIYFGNRRDIFVN